MTIDTSSWMHELKRQVEMCDKLPEVTMSDKELEEFRKEYPNALGVIGDFVISSRWKPQSNDH